MDNKKTLRNLAIYLGIPIIIIIVVASIYGGRPRSTETYSQILTYFEDGNVKKYTMDLGSGEMQITLRDDTTKSYTAPSVSWLYEDIKPYVDAYNAQHPDDQIEFDLKRPAETSWIMNFLPTILLFIGMIVFWWFIMKKMGGGMGAGGGQMNFGKAKIKNMNDEKRKTTFQDVAGADEEKEELEEIVQFLKDPKRYNELGARIPKGVLLVGALQVQVKHCWPEQLREKRVYRSSPCQVLTLLKCLLVLVRSRVRDLFDQAKKNSPCIIFIDEIDAVGRQRGAGLGGGHDEREQTLNQLLVEMDGFGANEGIIMIAATNRPDILALLWMRPGRFDRQVMVGYPDVKGREAILKVHARGKPLAPNVDLATIAKSTAGFTGADLENLLNEAALLAARKHLKAITMDEIEEATIKVVVGAEKKSHVMTDKEKTLTAYHEAGHAIAAYSCKTQDPVHQISIIPRGRAGGYTMQLPSEDRSYKSRSEMLESLVVLLGGRVAEALVLGDISTGASNDIERATQTVRAMITKYGMTDELGPITYGSDNSEPFLGRDMGHVRDYSEETASEIDAVLRKMISNAYHQTEQVLKEHMSKLHEVAKQLFLNEKMSGEEFYAIMGGVSPAEVPQEAGTTTENSVSENTEEKTEE